LSRGPYSATCLSSSTSPENENDCDGLCFQTYPCETSFSNETDHNGPYYGPCYHHDGPCYGSYSDCAAGPQSAYDRFVPYSSCPYHLRHPKWPIAR
jgi:hypothetical protein